jgi:pyruvate-formate lyase-activating enzyme
VDADGAALARALVDAHRAGALPLTSTCNLRCVFCSRGQNPRRLEVFDIPPRDLAAVREYLPLLRGAPKVVAGESATRINEGEPFTHPRLFEALTAVRDAYPDMPLRLTTNGTLLKTAAAAALRDLAPVEVTLSLNLVTPALRRELLGDAGKDAIRAPARLAASGIPFDGSVVALPHLTGWDELGRAVAHLCREGARMVRVLIPGHTRYAPRWVRAPKRLRAELEMRLDDLRARFPQPLVVEPPELPDLAARLEGVMPGGPAAAAGLRRGDVVLAVNGDAVRSRRDAYDRLRRAGGQVRVAVARPRGDPGPKSAGGAGPALGPGLATGAGPGAQHMEFFVEKEVGVSAGAVLYDDLSPATLDRLAALLRRHARRRLAVLTSSLARGALEAAVRQCLPNEAAFSGTASTARLMPSGGRAAPAAKTAEPQLAEAVPRAAAVRVIPVPTLLFGGSIASAGLLTVADMGIVLARLASAPRPFAVAIVPSRPFDSKGRDLEGRELNPPPGMVVEVCR